MPADAAASGTSDGSVQMRYKATFAMGFVAGYVLGSKAGRQRYEQLKRVMKSISENPQVKHTTEAMQSQATQLRAQATRKMQERAGTMSHELRDKVVSRLPGGLSDRFAHHTIDLDGQPAYADGGMSPGGIGSGGMGSGG
jgi:hypothetical protein